MYATVLYDPEEEYQLYTNVCMVIFLERNKMVKEFFFNTHTKYNAFFWKRWFWSAPHYGVVIPVDLCDKNLGMRQKRPFITKRSYTAAMLLVIMCEKKLYGNLT